MPRRCGRIWPSATVGFDQNNYSLERGRRKGYAAREDRAREETPCIRVAVLGRLIHEAVMVAQESRHRSNQLRRVRTDDRRDEFAAGLRVGARIVCAVVYVRAPPVRSGQRKGRSAEAERPDVLEKRPRRRRMPVAGGPSPPWLPGPSPPGERRVAAWRRRGSQSDGRARG